MGSISWNNNKNCVQSSNRTNNCHPINFPFCILDIKKIYEQQQPWGVLWDKDCMKYRKIFLKAEGHSCKTCYIWPYKPQATLISPWYERAPVRAQSKIGRTVQKLPISFHLGDSHDYNLNKHFPNKSQGMGETQGQSHSSRKCENTT